MHRAAWECTALPGNAAGAASSAPSEIFAAIVGSGWELGEEGRD